MFKIVGFNFYEKKYQRQFFISTYFFTHLELLILLFLDEMALSSIRDATNLEKDLDLGVQRAFAFRDQICKNSSNSNRIANHLPVSFSFKDKSKFQSLGLKSFLHVTLS